MINVLREEYNCVCVCMYTCIHSPNPILNRVGLEGLTEKDDILVTT